jgi:DNA replication factor GINS
MITYESLRKLISDEKTNRILQELPEDFFAQLNTYLKNKARMTGKEDRWELESAKSIIQDLMEIRERKILQLALYASRSGIKVDNLTPLEEQFFNSLVQNIKNFRKKRDKISEDIKLVTVAFLKDVPRFVGIDMRNYGPFSEGDVASLPEENAKLLVEKEMTKEIKTED